MRKKYPNEIVGRVFERLEVIQEGPKDKHGHRQFVCKCTCGNPSTLLIRKNNLFSGFSQSCGCLAKEINHQRKLNFNQYEVNGDITVFFDSDGDKCYIDTDLLPIIKEQGCWHKNKAGYWVRRNYLNSGKKNGENLFLHRFIMNPPENVYIDHIDRNPSNNRKNNLRYCSNYENSHNKGVNKRNKSGFTGVYLDNRYGEKWIARLKTKEVNAYLGTYNLLEDAIAARGYAEHLLWGDYGSNRYVPASSEIKEEVEKFLKKKGLL